MNENRRRARTALFSLKEAVLDVYSKHERDTRVLSIPTTLENVLAYPERTNQIPGSNTVIVGILFHLQTDKYVRHHTNRGWEITEHAASLLETMREGN